MDYSTTCAGCTRSQDLDAVAGGIAKLPGDWVVNQYCGSEGFLGWLALQPRFHRMALNDLTITEARALGPNILFLDKVLTQYWSNRFPNDPVERVYVIYMFESEFAEPLHEPEERFHLHIHLIPRTKAFAEPGRLRFTRSGTTCNDGWHMPHLTEHGVIPEPYRLSPSNCVARASDLMNYIRHEAMGWPN